MGSSDSNTPTFGEPQTEKSQIEALQAKLALLEKAAADTSQTQQILQLRARQQAAVARLGHYALSVRDQTALLDTAVELVAETLEVEYTSVLEYQPEDNRLVMRSGGGLWKKQLAEGSQPLVVSADPQRSQSGYALQAGGPVVIEDFSKEVRFAPSRVITEHGVNSSVSIIIAGSPRPFGVLNVHAIEKRIFSPDDLNFLTAIANVLAAAIERLHTAQEIALLNAISTAAAGQSELNAILDVSLQRLAAAVNFTGGSIALVEGDELVIRAARGPFAATALDQRMTRNGGSLSWQVIEHAKPLLNNNLAETQLTVTTSLCSYLAVPLTGRGRVFGLLELDSTAAGAFRQRDLTLLQKVGSVLSGPVELALRYAGEVRALAQAEAAQRRQRFLAEASKVLTTSLDYQTTLGDMARLVIPYLADYCIIDLLDEQGGFFRRAVVAHRNPAKEEQMRTIQAQYPPDLNESIGIPRVVHSGQSEIVLDIRPEMLTRFSRNEEHRRFLELLNPVSGISLPLLGRDKLLGVLSLAYADSGRRYTPEEIEISEDLARRAALALDNARLYQQARAALEDREEFLGVAAHELKTPITGLKGYVQLLNRQLVKNNGQLDPMRLSQALTAIDRQSDKLSYLINQLLDVSRIEAGKLGLESQPTEVSGLVEEAVNTARLRTDKHTIEFESNVASLTARLDPNRLEQVVVNLLDNAIKYSPEGGLIKVVVEQPVNGQDFVLSVTDQGLGIPPERRAHIFERFYQAHERAYLGGMGLGLYITRQIIELHGGQIEAQFPEAGGTRMVVRLPLVIPA